MMKKVVVPMVEDVPTSGFLTRFLIYTAVVSFIAAVKWLMDDVKLFEHQRAIQLDAIKSLQKSNMKYDHKYKLTETMVKDIFRVLEESKNNLTEFGFVPGDPFPENETVRDAMSNVFENTAMFGDLILRLPDITHDIYDKNKHWEFLIGWAVWFSMESGVFQGPHEQLLSLMSMELGLIPKDESFVNPYQEMEILKEMEEAEKELEEKQNKEKSDKSKKKKTQNSKPKRKGPKLSGGHHTEL
ncbi:coiled-coil domain-containing protein 134-like isoform X2 [Ruditapes philippinarum]|uniref:coiled-coil domain-containing protein 134-like isoform X2 n=1 Tax=Ruditapes philippinarum TaxID=129788 RepID=UPI00295BA0DE|nr:coiled-coil domain-containing protein 134-like isoform X2 [Ruditapes philippinarum]